MCGHGVGDRSRVGEVRVVREGCYLILFFKQKTAYEMRISDWSSDVCSSDLLGRIELQGVAYSACNAVGAALLLVSLTVNFNLSSVIIEIFWLARSEERRVGKECVNPV